MEIAIPVHIKEETVRQLPENEADG